MAIEAHPLGILLAMIFLGSMGTLFLWMFRLPPVLPRQVITVRRTMRSLRRILVPVVESIPAGRAVELACRLGTGQKAEVILAYIIEVPLILPLNASMPEQAAIGRHAIQTAELIVHGNHLPVRSRMIPARHAADGILLLANDEDADVIVMGVGLKRRTTPDSIGRTATEVIRRAPCEVLLDKAPIPAE